MAGVTGTESAAFNVTPPRSEAARVHGAAERGVGWATITPAAQSRPETARQHGDELRRHCDRGIGTNPGGGALSGTTNPSAVNGVATFAD